MTGQGGWPMSVFLTPDLQPFYGGTYFPPDDRYGRPRLPQRLLLMLADAWQHRRDEIDEAAGEIDRASPGRGRVQAGSRATCDAESAARAAARAWPRLRSARTAASARRRSFCTPMDLRLLLRVWKRFGDDDALHMVRHTLDHMAMGGIYDHLGGGFARYSTDDRWLVPHFEKMLYDNALLVPCYLEAYSGDRRAVLSAKSSRKRLAWVQREMTSPEGPFYSTHDADSEGEEGKFYVWTAAEIETVLGEQDAATVQGVSTASNRKATGKTAGTSSPRQDVRPVRTAERISPKRS